MTDFSNLGSDVTTRYMNDYKYGLRFRMCMREINMISQYMEYAEGRRGGVTAKYANSHTNTLHIEGPGFALRMSYELWYAILPFDHSGYMSFGMRKRCYA